MMRDWGEQINKYFLLRNSSGKIRINMPNTDYLNPRTQHTIPMPVIHVQIIFPFLINLTQFSTYLNNLRNFVHRNCLIEYEKIGSLDFSFEIVCLCK